jgi:hypothetical protein
MSNVLDFHTNSDNAYIKVKEKYKKKKKDWKPGTLINLRVKTYAPEE